MRLLVIRHGPAGESETWAAESGLSDEQRPLTPRGHDRMEAAARGLREVAGEVQLVATSPLVRAVQTAGIVAEALGGVETAIVEELRPERSPEALLERLPPLRAAATVAVVGHEPHLGLLIGWLLTGRVEPVLELRKGGAVLLELGDPPVAGGARLVWALAPRHLRALGS
jgi:phosphohistidine phosphatase